MSPSPRSFLGAVGFLIPSCSISSYSALSLWCAGSKLSQVWLSCSCVFVGCIDIALMCCPIICHVLHHLHITVYWEKQYCESIWSKLRSHNKLVSKYTVWNIISILLCLWFVVFFFPLAFNNLFYEGNLLSSDNRGSEVHLDLIRIPFSSIEFL